MPVSEKTKIKVWGEAAARCAYCREQLIYSDHPKIDDSLVGEVCHIFAQGENGPRSNAALSREERDSPNNLMLLCKKHHKYVDDNPDAFPADKLAQIKLRHLEWITQNLQECSPWDCNLATLHYINVPRLAILSAICGEPTMYDIDTSKGLHSLGQRLAGVMAAYKGLLEKLHPKVIRGLDFSSPKDEWVGAIFEFDYKFRTKNGPRPDRHTDYSSYLAGSLDQDPHIYKKFKDWRLVMVIDPMWITSSTAFCDFSPSGGIAPFAGLAMVKSIQPDENLVFATPLVLGLAKGPWHELFG